MRIFQPAPWPPKWRRARPSGDFTPPAGGVDGRRVLLAMAVMVLALTSAGCTTYKVDQRIAYWQAEVAQGLPMGALKADAEAFFAARGTPLICCVRSEGPWYHMATERNVGRAIIMEYDVAVLVEIGDDQRVRSVRVQRWGVGL